jgi:cell division protein FtsI (penicillin-binding protein 3)
MTEWVPSRWLRVRLWFALALLGVGFVSLLHRAWQLQITDGDRYRQLAEEQVSQSIEIPPRRGRILDRAGGELAASAELDSVHANARQLAAKGLIDETIAKLAPVLKLEKRDLQKRLSDRKYFVWLKRRVSPEEARAVRELALPGVFVEREPRRYYPQRGLAGPLLGWAGLDSVGQEGLELSYDSLLRGTKAELPGLRDALGRAVLTDGAEEVDNVAGRDLVTSIDRFIQYRLERALEKGVHDHHAKAGVAVALDPRNGEIVAMAAVPSLNPNDPGDAPAKGARNRAVTDLLEPGSTMKTFSIAAALEAGIVKPDDNWFCENGRWPVGPAIIHDAEPIGAVTTTQVLAKSSNICTAKIAFRSGKERVREMLLRFGFARRTGVDLPGERAGDIRALPRMGPVDLATTSFGQGITATPLQIAAAYAAVANGGTWHKPHAMRRVVDNNGRTVSEWQPESRRVITAELAETLQKMLFAVTQKGGTAEHLSLPGYSFAGKTGTAQKAEHGHYSQDKWASSFVGFAPREDPRLVLYVMIDEPQGGHYGSVIAGPVWQETMIDALRWLGTPTSDVVVAAKPATPPMALPRDTGFVDGEAAPSDGEVPEFLGLGVREALLAARRAGLRIEIEGSGIAVGQDPGPGETVEPDGVCRVRFAPPG